MATANLRELKPTYLRLIDLLRRHRIGTLGKTGPINVPVTEIAAVEADSSPAHMEKIYKALINDKILRPIGKRAHPAFSRERGELVFDCAMTAEQMLDYRRSIIIEGSLGIRIDDHRGNYYEMYRNGYGLPPQRLSDTEGTLLHYLVDHADESLDRAWLTAHFRVTTTQLSSQLNSIRKKIERLGFSREEVDVVLPRYSREGVIFRIV